MSVTANESVKGLEQVWEQLGWNRKFENSTPGFDVLYVWHAYSASDVVEAKQILKDLLEEEEMEDGTVLIRTAHLGNWSNGEAIVICESELEDC